jgi:predicted restriction endonuclease
MKSSFFRSYLQTLARYKWLAVALFIASVGISGFMAFQIEPQPKYIAVGALRANTTEDSLTPTTRQIIQQGQQFSRAEELVNLLLAENVRKAVADYIQVSPEEVRQKLLLKLPSEETAGMLQVLYRDDSAETANQAVAALMEAMVQQSQLINNARLSARVEELKQTLPQARENLQQAEQKLYDYYGADEAELSRLEAEVTQQKERVEQLQAALSQAEASQSQMVSSLAIAQAPQVSPTKSNQRFFLTLSSGAIVGVLLGGGLILLLTAIPKKSPPLQLRQPLLNAYKGRCAITGCDVEDALEILWLESQGGDGTHAVGNGVVLRADIHKLFLAQQMAIEPMTLKVVLSPNLRKTSYGKLAGRAIALPDAEDNRPNIEAIERHYRHCDWIEAQKKETEEG